MSLSAAVSVPLILALHCNLLWNAPDARPVIPG
jgi:hypothetical protein